MGLFLLRFWPVLIPLLIYLFWLTHVGWKAKKAGNTPPHFRDGPWYWVVLASLLIGIGCLVVLGASAEGTKGPYVPPHMKDGQLIPGQVGSGQ
jgi:hypothetical protein